MSYADIVTGLHERFTAVSGLNGKPILDYEPTSIQDFPTLYTLLDEFDRGADGGRAAAGQVVMMRYRILHRLCFRWQDNQQAEQELIPFVNSVPAAVDADPQLGNRLRGNGAGYIGGMARIAECKATFVSIGGVVYRALDFYSDVYEKFAYKQAGL